MLFNNYNNLWEVTGIIDPNVTWHELSADINVAINIVAGYVGRDVIALASEDDKIGDLLRLPVGYFAIKSFYANNLVAHKPSGLKVQIDSDNEKMAWQWMLDADAQALEQKGYQALDLAIASLIEIGGEAWEKSPIARRLSISPIKTLAEFEDVFPIDGSYRFFYMLLPLISEAYGDVAHIVESVESDLVLSHLKALLPLMAIKIAVRRLSISVMPQGVVCRFSSSSQTQHASATASIEMINFFVDNLDKDIKAKKTALTHAVRQVNNSSLSAWDNKLINSSDNKFFSL